MYKPCSRDGESLSDMLCRLNQEASKRILELEEAINSLSVSAKEKEDQLFELKKEFGRKEKVVQQG